MLPTIEWQDDAVVMIDQRKLPASEIYVTLQDRGRSRQGDQDHGHSRRAGHRRGGGHGHRARACGAARPPAPSSSPPSSSKICDLMAATRPTAVNLFWAIERMKRAFARGGAGRRIGRRRCRIASSAKRERIHDEDVAELPRDGRVRRDAGAGRRAHPDALQRRRAGHRGLRHGARRHSRRGRGRASTSRCSPTRRGRSCRARA